jgi:hypothetical protein
MEANHVQTLMSDIVTIGSTRDSPLSNVPIQFGTFDKAVPSPGKASWTMYNSEFACYAFQASQFSWAVYNFSNGHFTSTIESTNLFF